MFCNSKICRAPKHKVGGLFFLFLTITIVCNANTHPKFLEQNYRRIVSEGLPQGSVSFSITFADDPVMIYSYRAYWCSNALFFEHRKGPHTSLMIDPSAAAFWFARIENLYWMKVGPELHEWVDTGDTREERSSLIQQYIGAMETLNRAIRGGIALRPGYKPIWNQDHLQYVTSIAVAPGMRTNLCLLVQSNEIPARLEYRASPKVMAHRALILHFDSNRRELAEVGLPYSVQEYALYGGRLAPYSTLLVEAFTTNMPNLTTSWFSDLIARGLENVQHSIVYTNGGAFVRQGSSLRKLPSAAASPRGEDRPTRKAFFTLAVFSLLFVPPVIFLVRKKFR